MKKKIIFLLAILLISPLISADLTIEYPKDYPVLFPELDKPAVFYLNITNNKATDNFKFYNLLSFDMEPERVTLVQGQSKEVEVKIYPKENFNFSGYYTIQYFIKGEKTNGTEDKLTMKVATLKDAFEVGSSEIDPESNSIQIYIHNKEKFDFEEMKTKFTSPFFEIEKEFSLGPNERQEFDIELNKEDFEELTAGFYTLNAEVNVEGKKADIEGTIKFTEKNIVTTTEKDYAFPISTKIISKTNQGNTVSNIEVTIDKNIISRLFTSFDPKPTLVERKGFGVEYYWNLDLNPSETIDITVRTNWFLPLLIIILIVAIVAFVKKFSRTDLIVRKKVSHVKTAGGEFALKVSLAVNAKTYIERIRVMDRLPALVKIHERFGGEIPTKTDEKNRIIEWELQKLEPGEIRILSYVIYSKIGVLGKFALPPATAVYEKNGKIKDSTSNRAFFISEARPREDFEREF